MNLGNIVRSAALAGAVALGGCEKVPIDATIMGISARGIPGIGDNSATKSAWADKKISRFHTSYIVVSVDGETCILGSSKDYSELEKAYKIGEQVRLIRKKSTFGRTSEYIKHNGLCYGDFVQDE